MTTYVNAEKSKFSTMQMQRRAVRIRERQSQTRIPIKLYNGLLYTMDESKPWADAALIDSNGIFQVVGSLEDVDNYISINPNQQQNISRDELNQPNVLTEIDLNGQLVLPGFHDVHIHAVEAGAYSQICYVPEETNVRDIPDVLKACPNGGQLNASDWIVGAGFDVGRLLEQTSMPQRFLDPYVSKILDKKYPRNPVLVLDNLGHGAICNTEAYYRVGFDRLYTDPGGGKILYDERDQFMGIVLENAQQPLRDAAFTDDSQMEYNLLIALHMLNAYGITTVSDAGGFWRQNGQIESWARVQKDNLLTVRASNALYIYPDMTMDEQLPKLLERAKANTIGPNLRFDQAKIYVDGILEMATGALKEPYLSDLQLPPEEEYGFEYFGDRLQSVSQILIDHGFQLHFHATGDRGAALALDAIASIPNANTTGPHRITHCYLVDEVDRERFAKLNVVADFQLAPSSLDPEYATFLESYMIGSVRTSGLLPAKEMYNAGALLTLSSDWDADELSPFVKMQSVLTRPDGRSFDNLETILPMMTINAAKLLKQDNITGSLEVGKYADLVVISKNIFQIPVNEISTAQASWTMLQGEIVFNASEDTGVRSFYDSNYSGSCRPTSLYSPLLYFLYVLSWIWIQRIIE